jgi:hypothetical protein
MTGGMLIGMWRVTRRRLVPVVAAAMLLPFGAAAQQDRPPAGAAASAGGAAEGELLRQELPDAVLESLRAALGTYEEMRGDLAADRLEGIRAGALRVAGALRAALPGDAELTGSVPAVIEEAAEIAEAMAEAGDLAAARADFGELSRRVLLLAGHDRRLVEGWQVFACPMADGFGKWIQPTDELDNPYMGTAMPRCGAPSDWSVPEPPGTAETLAAAAAASPAAEETEAHEASGPEPIFRPGIPGLRMVDVRDHKFLWREIDELQAWERGNRITVAEYRSKVIEKTAQFLGFTGPAAGEFAKTAFGAVAMVREAFFDRPQTGGETGGVEARFPSDLEEAVARLTSALDEDEPRHRLFAPEGKRWLLRLAFGPREAKEAREARQAEQAPADRGGQAEVRPE